VDFDNASGVFVYVSERVRNLTRWRILVRNVEFGNSIEEFCVLIEWMRQRA